MLDSALREVWAGRAAFYRVRLRTGTPSALIVPEERTIAAATGLPPMCVMSVRIARSLSTESDLQLKTAIPLASLKPIIRAVISTAPKLPTICSMQLWTVRSMTSVEIGFVERSLTRTYLREYLRVSCRPPQDPDTFFELRSTKSLSVFLHHRIRVI